MVFAPVRLDDLIIESIQTYESPEGSFRDYPIAEYRIEDGILIDFVLHRYQCMNQAGEFLHNACHDYQYLDSRRELRKTIDHDVHAFRVYDPELWTLVLSRILLQ